MKPGIGTAKYFFLLIPFLILFFPSCSITRRLQPGEYLLNKTIIIDRSTYLDKSEIGSYIRQKPNRKILGMFRFHLRMYNLIDPKKAEAQRVKRDKKIDEKNEKRKRKGQSLKNKERLTWREWVMSIGEPPVILDSFLTQRSVKQIQLFLSHKGFFSNSVKDSVVVNKKKKADVYYLITASKPYRVRTITYDIKDNLVSYYVLADASSSFVKCGDVYDADVLQAERERIAAVLKNEGYYFFSREFIFYKVDSALSSRQVDVIMIIKNFQKVSPVKSDSIIESEHTRYYIGNIYVQPDFITELKNAVPADTTATPDFILLHNGPLKIKTSVLGNAIYVHQGELYQQTNSDLTYKRISELNAFKMINIDFRQSPDAKDKLDCWIRLTPMEKQAFAIGPEATSTGGNLGVAGYLNYQNRNVFKGAEVFEFKLRASLEIQKDVNGTASIPIGIEPIQKASPFNTIQAGPEFSLNIPRPLFPFNMFRFVQSANPKSKFTLTGNYQQRPDFTRKLFSGSYGFSWYSTKTQRFVINPFDVSYVNVFLQPEFKKKLQQENNLLLLSSYSDVLVAATNVSFIYNNQDVRKNRGHIFFRSTLEGSGNTLRGFASAWSALIAPWQQQDGSYEIARVKFSQYVRPDFDFRFYAPINEKDKFVFRAYAGAGFPLNNLDALPFSKSFFGGSANTMRAWRARTLGPGSYKSAQAEQFDQIGDNQIEMNAEYRFNLFKMINMALFADAGNIWLWKTDPLRPGGELFIRDKKLTKDDFKFMKEFAD